MNIFELSDKLVAFKWRKKEIEAALKNVSSEIEKIESEMLQLMTADEIQSFNRGGKTFYLNMKIHASANSEKKAELYDALKDNGYGDLVYETVNANSLAAFVREQIEQNEEVLPEWLEGKVKVFEKSTVGMRKGKS